MSSVNKVILLGNLGKDPESKYTPDGKSVCNFSLATSFKTKGGSEQVEWHNIEAWDKEKVCSYLKKGKQVHVIGRIKTDSWEKDGERKYRVKIVADEITLVGSASASDRSNSSDSSDTRGSAPVGEDDVPF